MAQSAVHAGCLPNELSFKHALQIWLARGRHAQVDSHDLLMAMLNAIAQKRVGNRPNRIEPRIKKRPLKLYQWLKKPRNSARLNVIKHGHGTKLVPYVSAIHPKGSL